MTSYAQVQFDFSGKAVLVTGGSNGIGNAIARGFREAGAEVAITGTKAAAGDYDTDIAAMAYHRLDMEDSAGIDALGASFERLDVLVNNAGNTIRGPAAREPDNFAKVVDIHLNGSYRMTHGVLGQLKAAKGSVINIASMTSYFASARGPGYGAAKAGILQLTKSQADAWAADGVRVNAIAPGWIVTNLTGPVHRDDDFRNAIIERTAMKRWGTADELAGTALFLASDAAAFVTGVTVPVDGGYSAL